MIAWAITVLGGLGPAAAIGLLRHAGWGRPAVLAVGAVIGLTVSALILV